MGMNWEPFGMARSLGEEAEALEPVEPAEPSPPAEPPPLAEPAAPSRAATLPREPARHLVVITCMDARVDPAQALGLAAGDALRSLVISQQLLGTREVLVVHHTDCGMLTFTNDQLRDRLREHLGADASGVDFLPFADLEQSVRDDVATIRASPLVPDDVAVRGFVYDVRSGRLREVA